MREFEKFGKHKLKVKKLVDDDDLKLSKKFYGNLSRYFDNVTYIDYFWNAYSEIKNKKEPYIIITRIELFNQYEDSADDQTSFHAVALVKDKDQFYMFDPNGIFKKTDTMLYVDEHGKTFYSETFSKKYKFKLPRYRGVQYYSPDGPDGYIGYGGYCMFYTYIGVEKVLQIYSRNKNENLALLFQKLTEKKKNFEELFPRDIHVQSVKLIKSIF